MAPETKPVEFVDILFLAFIVAMVMMDTLIMAFAKIDSTMLPIFAAFASTTVSAPLAAWVGFRYGSSQGSKNKDDALSAAVQKAAE